MLPSLWSPLSFPNPLWWLIFAHSCGPWPFLLELSSLVFVRGVCVLARGSGLVNPVWKLWKQALRGSICLKATIQLEEVVERWPGISAGGNRQAEGQPWIWDRLWPPLRHLAPGSSVLNPWLWGGREWAICVRLWPWNVSQVLRHQAPNLEA